MNQMSPSGYTGHLFEEEVLGTCLAKAVGYMKFREAMDVVARNQPCDPHHPRGEAAVLHGAVARELDADSAAVELYTAVGSTLDRFHGIDGFFVFEGIVVTIDLTINPNKDAYKAKVIVTMEDAENGFRNAASEVAGCVRIAKACGWKGVV